MNSPKQAVELHSAFGDDSKSTQDDERVGSEAQSSHSERGLLLERGRFLGARLEGILLWRQLSATVVHQEPI